jgi:serine/threonine-protein kinase
MPMTPSMPSPFAAPPAKKDQGRPFAMILVSIAGLALAAVIALVVWPRISTERAAPASTVGVVVMAPPTSAPAVDEAPPTSVALAPPTGTPPASETHRTPRRRTDPTPRASETTAPPPSSAAPATGNGFLSLITSPWTHVTEGGRDLGDTPLMRVPLPAGHHSLRLVNGEAGISETYEVDITAGETTSRRLGLH